MMSTQERVLVAILSVFLAFALVTVLLQGVLGVIANLRLGLEVVCR